MAHKTPMLDLLFAVVAYVTIAALFLIPVCTVLIQEMIR